MKRQCRDIKKIMRMKWRSLAFTKSVTRRPERPHKLKKYQGHSSQMNLKKYQDPLMIQASKNRSLKKHQEMEKRPLEGQGKKLKRPLQRQEKMCLKKHQSHLSLLTQER